ncbi:ricin-type beta-trefoil lectin domain-containing protein [Favolaschia claudopus]|uniref:Ricin-type beta-trefoil lectin domain-containing protein n=1 Tax=Favolaschia claudopus TaxID=2862362 RepID=A0AAV9ZDJ9_9AGAR
MPIFNGNYTITNFQSHTRVDLDGVLTNKEDGARVQGWEPLDSKYDEYKNQIWNIVPTTREGVDSYYIINIGSGTLLEISGGNGTDGTPVTASSKASDPTPEYQEWEFVKIKDNYYKVRNLGSGSEWIHTSSVCLYNNTGIGWWLTHENILRSSTNGTKIQGWWGQLDPNENQLWSFELAKSN